MFNNPGAPENLGGPLVTLDASFTDGTSNTILLMEGYSVCQLSIADDSANLWSIQGWFGAHTALRRRCKTTLLAASNANMAQSPRPSGILVALVDGSVRLVTPPVFLNAGKGETWDHAINPSDGFVLGTDW